MQKRKSFIIALLSLILPISICTAQQNKFKLVPDSLRCLTPAQITKHIEDSYTMKGLFTTVELQATIIDTLHKGAVYLKNETIQLKAEISENNKEINLHLLQNQNCQMDYKHLNELNIKANRKITVQKVGLYILGGLCLTELGYIGILKSIH